MYRGKAVGRVKNNPISRRKLCKERQKDVTQYPNAGHAFDVIDVGKSIAFSMVSESPEDWRNQPRDQCRIDLAITIDFHADVGPSLQRRRVTRADGATDA